MNAVSSLVSAAIARKKKIYIGKQKKWLAQWRILAKITQYDAMDNFTIRLRAN